MSRRFEGVSSATPSYVGCAPRLEDAGVELNLGDAVKFHLGVDTALEFAEAIRRSCGRRDQPHWILVISSLPEWDGSRDVQIRDLTGNEIRRYVTREQVCQAMTSGEWLGVCLGPDWRAPIWPDDVPDCCRQLARRFDSEIHTEPSKARLIYEHIAQHLDQHPEQDGA